MVDCLHFCLVLVWETILVQMVKSNMITFFSRRSAGNIYQSTNSLHSDGHSSTSMSPAPSPSPTHHNLSSHHHHHTPHHYTSRASTAPIRGSAAHGHHGPHPSTPNNSNLTATPKNRPLSGSMSNLSLSGSRKWNSTSDFRDQSPGPNSAMAR